MVIFNEFKKICRNADDLLRKYQINKTDSPEGENSTQNTKGNGKCKSIRNSDDMAQRIRETAYKKSITFVENMKSFYFLLNQIENLENGGGGQVIIKNEISTESLIPAVELNIKNEIIYPNEDNNQGISGVIQQNPETSGESKRKKRKNNKRKPAAATVGSLNGSQQTMEIDETGNIVATRQIVITTSDQQQQHHHLHHSQQHPQHHQNIQISTQNNNEMALMLTVKSIDQDHVIATSTGQQQILQPTQIQIHSSNLKISFFNSVNLIKFLIIDHPLPSLSSTSHHSVPTTTNAPQTITTILQYSCSTCHEIFNTTDSLRQHLFHAHQILFPFTTTTPTAATNEHQYQQVTLPQTSNSGVSQIVATTTTMQPSTNQQQQQHQQYTTFTHKKFFETEFPCMLCGVLSKNQDDLIKHMIQHTTTTSSSQQAPVAASTSTIQKVTTIIERDRNSSALDIAPTDLSTQYK